MTALKSGEFKKGDKVAFRYIPDGKVLSEFFWDRSEVSIIQGPVGSGTSTACCFKMWKISMEQEPDPLGVRRTRWMIIRNTYADLKDTTMKTWADWFVRKARGQMGELLMTNPPRQTIHWAMPDGTTVEAEFIFTALDDPNDIKTLLSREVTGVWFNEAQFTPKEIFDAAHSRAIQGRFPPRIDGGPTWKGVLCDLNAPPEGHWIPYMRGDIPLPLDWDDDKRREFTKPDGWSFFVQPAGLIEIFEGKKLIGYEENPAAENTRWLSEPYTTLVKGKTKEWIDTFVMNRVGLYQEGKPVHPTFVRESHVADKDIEYRKEWPLIVGMDFARYPAAIFMQNIRGQVVVLNEFGMDNVSAETFAPRVREFIMENFPGAFEGKIQMWGDPTGDSAGQGTDNTPFQIFAKNQMHVAKAPGGNKISIRLATIDNMLAKMVDGQPGLLVSPNCGMLKVGMSGGYHFKKLRGHNAYHTDPAKNRYADYCDALQYGVLGMGMGVETLTGAMRAPRPGRRKRTKFSLARRGR